MPPGRLWRSPYVPKRPELAPKPINTSSEWALQISCTVLYILRVQTGPSLLQKLLLGPLGLQKWSKIRLKRARKMQVKMKSWSKEQVRAQQHYIHIKNAAFQSKLRIEPYFLRKLFSVLALVLLPHLPRPPYCVVTPVLYSLKKKKIMLAKLATDHICPIEGKLTHSMIQSMDKGKGQIC